METIYQKLIEGNRNWVSKVTQEDPNFFKKLSEGQRPPVLWIGCADSRVPANQITGTKPGDIFVHRNIANMVVHSDMNMLSVVDYAVNVLEVKHVIVCGHYGCGGVIAALGNKQYGLIDNWLRNIKDVYRLHKNEMDAMENETQRANRLVELNVIEQVYNLSKTSAIQNAWKKRKEPAIHGWVYDIANGLIRDLNVSVSDDSGMSKVYKLESFPA